MHSKRFLDLLVIGLSALSVADATFVHGRVDVRNVKAIQQRQQGADDTQAPAPPAATNTDTNTPTPTPIPSSTPPPPVPSSEPVKPSDPTTPPPVTSSKTSPTPQQPTPPTSNKPNPSPSTPNPGPPQETTPPPNQPTSEPPKVVKTITTFATVTNSDGSKSTIASEVVTTQPAGLADGSNNNGSSGMSETTRNTVIGVVVGVGGAIILIGLAFVAWRIWGRKKNQDEGLMDYTTPNDGKSEVGGSMSGRTPFQSTLESYHAPTQVNQAANF